MYETIQTTQVCFTWRTFEDFKVFKSLTILLYTLIYYPEWEKKNLYHCALRSHMWKQLAGYPTAARRTPGRSQHQSSGLIADCKAYGDAAWSAIDQ